MDKAPDAYRTISEVGEDLDIAQHVLRFWETRFPQIKPLKRGGGRRYYRPDDVELLKGIRHLLYREGYTIKGVQRILKEQGAKAVQAVGRAGSLVPGLGPASPEDAFDDFVPQASTATGLFMRPRRLRRHRPLRHMCAPDAGPAARTATCPCARNLVRRAASAPITHGGCAGLLHPWRVWRARPVFAPVDERPEPVAAMPQALPTIKGKRPVGRPAGSPG